MAGKQNRIDVLFDKKRQRNKKALIIYITAGFPELAKTEETVYTIEEAGADLIELGVPFSDPILDGPTIQRSSAIALEKGATVKGILAVVKRIRKNSSIPIVLFSSFNPLLRFGLKEMAKSAKEVGIDGILVPDLPPEQGSELRQNCQANGLHLVYLIAPTTPPERKKLIAEQSGGFIYYVSLKGVTGARNSFNRYVTEQVKEIKKWVDKPVAVGFGISRPEHVQLATEVADAAVVGSAVIDVINKFYEPGSNRWLQELSRFVHSLSASL